MGGFARGAQHMLPLDVTSDHRIADKKAGKLSRIAPPSRKPLDLPLIAALSDVSRVVFLDIETTGLSRYYDYITVIGWLVGGDYRVYVSGDDPSALIAALRAASAVVTFNGTLFDLPFLRKTFPGIALPTFHADLRYLAKRIGLSGGQKKIENAIGLNLRSGIEDVDGAEAVLLWHRYLRGDLNSLRRLIEYNRSDVFSMCDILDYVLENLVISPDFWFKPQRFSKISYRLHGHAISHSELPAPSRLNRPQNTFKTVFGGTFADQATIVGIDLTGSEAKPSGWCLLRGRVAETAMVASDDELVRLVESVDPDLVSIDSPLSIPFGRTTVYDDDPARFEIGIMRRSERELKRRGINVYPCLLQSMQNLTRRGMALADRLRRKGIPVIESYPGAAQDIMGIPRKGAGEAFLKQGLADFGIEGPYISNLVRHDELDAITSALVGSFFLANKFEALGDAREAPLIIPDLKGGVGPLVVGFSGRISAGKTTAARFLETQGFAYTRFSLVIDEEIQRQGQIPNRESRQKMGQEIHETWGQRLLCHRTLERAAGAELIVVDGLRFPEDHCALFERYGARFLHLYIAASDVIRSDRYLAASNGETSFPIADRQPVEAQIDELRTHATAIVRNESTIDEFQNELGRILSEFRRRSAPQCPSL